MAEIGHIPKPLFIPETGRPKTLEVHVERGPGTFDVSIHMVDIDTGIKLGVLVISKLWIMGNDEAGG